MNRELLAERLFARTEPVENRRSSALMWATLSLLAVLIGWSAFAQLEEQVRSPGTVIASSRSQVVQAVDGGTVLDLRVKEGDIVKAGDMLAVLDPTRFEASSGEIEAKVAALRATIQRLSAELDGHPLVFSADVQGYPDVIATQQNLYARRRQSLSEDLAALGRSLSLAQEELKSLENLAYTGDAATSEVLRSRRQVNELRGQMVNKRNAYRQESQTELAKAEAELAQTTEVLTQRQQALNATQIKAPMSGTIKNVRFTTKGAVLRPGDELLQIVPSDDQLIIEAKVRPADVAFLRNDLSANVKLDAYDYTIYGNLPGTVIYISPDTLEENVQKGEQPYYRVHIRLMPFDPANPRHQAMDIRPGMTATTEIITGQKSVMNYLLKPLRRGVDAALHER